MKKNNSLQCAFLFLLFVMVNPLLKAQSALQIDTPASIAGNYPVAASFFSGDFNSESGELVLVNDGVGNTSDGCEVLMNLDGKIALIDRGDCAFTQKALNAQDAGAIAVVICNNEAGTSFMMPGSTGGQMNIPVMLLDMPSCNTIKSDLVGATASIIPPSPSETCITALDAMEGTNTTTTINSGFSGSIIAPATHARWFKYSAISNTLLCIQSCEQGVDTRLIVIPSDNCEALSDHLYVNGGGLAASIDDCDDGSGFISASDLTIPILEGESYFIIWDDGQSPDGFEFQICTEPLPEVEYTFNVNMNNEVIDSEGAYIAGSFNNWTPEPMNDNSDGTYSITLDLEEYTIHNYKFLNGPDGWENHIPLDCQDESGFGNRELEVPLGGGETPFFCFNSCEECPTCEDPAFIYEDDFEDASIGDISDESVFWTTWPGASQSALVSTNFAADSEQSLHFSGDFNDQDVLMLLGDRTTGHYGIAWEMYIPEGKEAYFNFQHAEATGNFAFNCYFESPDAFVDIYDKQLGFEFPYDEWFPMVFFIDLDNDLVRFFLNNEFVGSWPFSIGDYTGDGSDPATPDLTLGAINFYTFDDPDYDFYIDNVEYAILPKAQEGFYCQTATSIQPGVHSVPELACFGGLDFDNGGVSGAWYSYTPDEDGWISVSSCEGGADTRVWVLSGDCTDFNIQGLNDDICQDGTGAAFASYREVVVKAGVTYYILWDNIWDDAGFDFSLDFTPGDAVPGNFCATATPISYGTHTIDAYTGNASVAGPVLEAETSYTGNVQSEWFSFTPTEDTLVNLYTCDLTLEDTRFWVYIGSCDSFENLELIATSDDDCGNSQSGIYEWAVTAGTTYFIEFDNLGFQDMGAHDFVLEPVMEEVTVDVTFTVQTELFLDFGGTISPTGMHIVGTFNNFIPAPMTDNGDESWSATYKMEPFSSFEFRFMPGDDPVVDGFEGMPGSAIEDCGNDDGVGGFNRIWIIEDANTEYIACYDHCVTCELVDIDEATFAKNLQIAPNPASGNTLITYQFQEALNFEIQLRNSLGQQLSIEQINNAIAGSHELDLSNLPAGIYFVVFGNGKHVVSKKLVIK